MIFYFLYCLGLLSFTLCGRTFKMIKVKRNPNFKEWIQVFSLGKMIDEVRRESQAMEIAKREAKKTKVDKFIFLDELVDIDQIASK